MGVGTLAVWAGEEEYLLQGATQVPVVRSVAFGYADLDEWEEVALGRRRGHIYSRNTNPTVEALEAKVRSLEGAEACISFSTGMAAVSASVLALASTGSRVVGIADTYGGTSKLFLDILPRFGIEVVICETANRQAIERELGLGADILYLESPTNPTLKILDIRRLSAVAHSNGARVIVDNTLATPINQNPLNLGADIVLHSATKYLSGHGDALGGVACGSSAIIHELFRFREITGASLHAESAYLIMRGMKTLLLRVERQNETAIRIARFLQKHDQVEEVFYPGLESHPSHSVAVGQMSGFGGMVTFSVVGGYERVRTMLPKLRLAHRAANLGSVETFVGPPRTTSHVELSEDERRSLGIPEGLIRYSVGIEDPRDLIADLEASLRETTAPDQDSRFSKSISRTQEL
ncbi:MAG: cystathionine gamma-synthase family protein [Acidimicrobiaceae bacterium]|nr:cystathionine gamma-synthase family protein [Acidimicrobiaceae bacterium]